MFDRAMMQKLNQIHHDERLEQAARDRLARQAREITRAQSAGQGKPRWQRLRAVGTLGALLARVRLASDS